MGRPSAGSPAPLRLAPPRQLAPRFRILSKMRDAPSRHARERIWILSPALATGLFFGLKLLTSASDPLITTEGISGAGAQTPVAMPTQVRVVAELRRADVAVRAKRAVPNTEADLMRLFEQEGTVTFLAGEVEVVATSAPEFAPTQIDVRTDATQTPAAGASTAHKPAAR